MADYLDLPGLPVSADMLLGGEWVAGQGERIAVHNPAHPNEIVGSVPRGTPHDVELAVAAAKAAQPAWARKSFADRALILGSVLECVSRDIDKRAALYCRENGKTIAEARGELMSLSHVHRLTLENAGELDSGRQLPAAEGRTIVSYVPYGVVLSIVPWNSPVALGFLQLIPALLAGNAVVLKPPESCPLTLISTIAQIVDLLPRGIVNVVTGLPDEIGDALTTHPDVAKIGFTGSIRSATHIMANAARSIKGVTLELGGNDPAIVMPDADLGSDAMQLLCRSAFQQAGQICLAVKRVYVHESIYLDFLEAFSREVDRYIVGDGLDSTVTLGPMHTRAARDRASALVADAKRAGATVLGLGKIGDRKVFESGHFMQPSIVTDIADDDPLVIEEQFCPSLPILSFHEVDDVVTRANRSRYGLGASVWSKDVDGAIGIARRLEAGTVFVNTHGVTAINRKAPYGGFKQSGLDARPASKASRNICIPTRSRRGGEGGNVR